MENKLYKDTLLTEKGYEAANLAANGQGSFTITRVVASENAYKGKNENELRQLLSLDNEIPGAILEENTVNTKMAAIKTGLSNELNTNGYVANTVGLYARLNGGPEFLYSVTPSENGQIVPRQDNNVFSGFKLTIYVLVGNSQKLEVNLSPGGDATIDYVNKAVSRCRDELLALINKKENITDHNTDINNINKALATKVTFNGGSITTGNGSFIPASIGDVVKDNHDGTINYNGNELSLNKTITPDTDIFNLWPGVYRSLWGYQNTLKNYPSPNGSAFIIVSGADKSIGYGRKITVIDSWGGQFNTLWQNDHFMPWWEEVKRSDIDGVRNTINNDIQPKLDNKVSFSGGSITTGNGTFVPAAIGDVVKDNHDGTITYNGNNYAINKTINSSTDYNTITTPGTYLCLLSGKWPNTPLAGTGVNATVILNVENDNAGDVFQTAYAPAIYKPIIRQYSFGKWSAWQQSAIQTDVDTINKTLATKVTFDGGKITTGFGTFVPAAIGDVESGLAKKEDITAHNTDINNLSDKVLQYRGEWSEKGLWNLQTEKDGIYYVATNHQDGIPGWNNLNSQVIKRSTPAGCSLILIDSWENIWQTNNFNGTFGAWLKLAVDTDVVNLTNRVNGVLARQHDIMVNLANVYAGGNLDLLQTIAFTNGKMTLYVYSSLSGSAMGNAAYDFKTRILTLNFGYAINVGNGTLGQGNYGKGEFMYIDLSPLYKYFSGWSMGATNLNLRNNKDDSVTASFGGERINIFPGRTAYGGGFQNNTFENATIVLNHN